MKILHTADWHIGKNVNSYSLLDDQKYVLSCLKNIILSNYVDVIIISGDVFDRAIPSYEAMAVFEEFINDIIIKYQKKVIIITGNHDNERLGFGSQFFKNSNLYIFSRPSDMMIDGVHFYMIPYLNIHQFREIYGCDFPSTEEAYQYVIDSYNLDYATYNVLVAHDYFTYNQEKLLECDSEMSVTMGGSSFVDAKKIQKFNYVALGHMHQAQRVGSDKVRYSGSILKYSFSEVNHQKSVTIIDTDNGFTQIPLMPKHDMVIIKGELNDLLQKEFYEKYNYQNDYFKAILLDNNEVIDAYSKLKSIYPNLMEIYKEKINGSINVMKDKIVNKSQRELFELFYREVTLNDMTPEEKTIIDEYLKEDKNDF